MDFRSSPRLIAPALLLIIAACAGNSNGDDDDVAADVAHDTAGDATEPDSTGADTDATPDDGVERCVPGTRRCLESGTPAYDLCIDDGEWQRFLCDAARGEICFQGECRPRICEPFEVDSCVDCRTYIGCDAGGTSRGENPVPLDRKCEVIDGVAQIVRSSCTPGAVRCADGNANVVETCGECGDSWSETRDCFAEDNATVCDLGQCITQCEFIRKRDSYVGCEYWAVDLDNAFVQDGRGALDADGKPFAIVMSNPSATLSADVVISMVDGPVHTATIAPGGLEIASMHIYNGPDDEVGRPMADLQGTMIGSQAFRVESSIPIVAYQFNPLDNEEVFSNDASLLFPTSSLGTEYWVMTRRQTFDTLKGYVTVIAVLPGQTDVTVTLPPFTLENPVVTLPGRNHEATGDAAAIPTMRGGDEPRTFTLQQFQVLNIETNRPGADLTGTYVTATRQVAVFGGAEAANAPNDDSCVFRPSVGDGDWVCEATRRPPSRPVPCVNDAGEPDITLCSDYITCCADHIEHQMLPTFAWGRRFNAARSMPRGDEADIWRVLAAHDATTVELIGLPDSWHLPNMMPNLGRREYVLNRGEWVEFQSPVDFEIEANRPIMVGQFLAAEFAPYPQSIGATMPPHRDAGTGDPAFILGVPTEQYRSEYTFLAPNAFEFDYVTITAPVGAEVWLDGERVPDEEFAPFGSGAFAAARLLIADGAHRLEASAPVGLMVHGYDRFVSYGYPGGMDLRDISGARGDR